MNIEIPCPRSFLPKQKEVLDATKHKKYILYSGAFGAGKTILLAHVVIRECIANPRSLWFVGSQTVPMLRDTVVRTFLEEIDLYQVEINKTRASLPKEDQYILDFRIEKQWRPSIMEFRFFNDSTVLFRSCDEPSKFKSLNLDGFAIDEPVDIDEDVFLMLQGRLRGNHTKNRLGVMAGNPAGKTNWVYQTFFERKMNEYYVVHTTTYDNSFLPLDYITSCEMNYDADYARRYLRGEWGSFEGQVYKDFSIDKHVGDYADKEYNYYIGGYDDGYRNPACFLTIGIDGDRNMYVVDEYYEKGRTSSEIAEDVHELDKKFNYHKIYADPSALNWIEVAKQKKIRVEDGNNEIDTGIAKLKMFFKNDIIHIDRGCKNLVKELESYRYEKDRFSQNLTEKPIKKDDHACDALRYACTEFNPFKRPTICAGGRWK